MFTKRALKRSELAIAVQPFYRSNRRPFCLYCEHQAGSDRLAVNDDGACSAHAHLTADIGPRQSQFMPEKI
jgi:hypothetical protein